SRARGAAQTAAPEKADGRAAVRLEEHRDAVVSLHLPAETLRVELLGPVHVLDAEEDRAHVRLHDLSPWVVDGVAHDGHATCGSVAHASRFLTGVVTVFRFA